MLCFFIYGSEIQQAIARKHIDEEYCISWVETRKMNKIYHTLNDVKECINSLDDETLEKLEEDYNIKLNLHDLNFWEVVLKIKMDYI